MKKVGEFNGIDVMTSPLIPENEIRIVTDLEPRPFQKEMFEKMVKVPKDTLLQLPPRPNYFYGIDYSKGTDTTVVARAKMNGAGITSIVFDECAGWPDYKWYRNPIKWWQWRRILKIVEKQTEKHTL